MEDDSIDSFKNGEIGDEGVRDRGDLDGAQSAETARFDADEIDSTCSTPYVSAPSSPGRSCHPADYFFSAPASPMHYVLSSAAAPSSSDNHHHGACGGGGVSSEFEFAARFPTSSSAAGAMTSADELFLNGQIRPMKLSSHLQRPQVLAPLIDGDEEDEDKEADVLRRRESRLRNRSVHRRTRSLSPLRNSPFRWSDEHADAPDLKSLGGLKPEGCSSSSEATTPSVSASSSRSSSGRSSRRWSSLKDFLYRSKSEGRSHPKDKFWSSISPFKDKKPQSLTIPLFSEDASRQKGAPAKKPLPSASTGAGPGKRRVLAPSAHERHYTANRAQMEEMRKKTYLPYRQGLLGCLGFSSRSYGAMNGLAKTLNPVSSL